MRPKMLCICLFIYFGTKKYYRHTQSESVQLISTGCYQQWTMVPSHHCVVVIEKKGFVIVFVNKINQVSYLHLKATCVKMNCAAKH